MEVKFADTFGESLQRMIDRNKWYWKTWDFFRQDLPRFFKNIWRFRKALWNHYWWDHHGILRFMEIGLDHMSTNLEEKGLEVDESRLKKVAAMKRVAQLIRNYNEDLYIEMAEAELGEIIHHEWNFIPVEGEDDLFELEDKDTPEEKEHNRKVFARAREIEEAEWNELWQLVKGQDHAIWQALVKDVKTNEDKKEEPDYYDWFDGSGMKSWWD
jgi:hypothetical protein